MLNLTGVHKGNEITQTITEFVSDGNGSYLSVIPKIYEVYKKTIEVSDNTWFHGAGGEGYHGFNNVKDLLNEQIWKAVEPTDPASFGYKPPKKEPKLLIELKSFNLTNTESQYLEWKLNEYIEVLLNHLPLNHFAKIMMVIIHYSQNLELAFLKTRKMSGK